MQTTHHHIVSVIGLWASAACADSISDPNPARGGEIDRVLSSEPATDAGSEGGDIPGGPTVVPSACTAPCCPTSESCYGSGKQGPGAECLAQRDNSLTKRIQLRQAWARSILPIGNDDSLVGSVLLQRSELPWPECNLRGASGYIQLLDLDIRDPMPERHVSRLGYARYLAEGEAQAAAVDGLCMVSTVYDKPEWRLGVDDMSPADGYPRGLPAPMPMPWRVDPVQARRVQDDFDVETDRDRILGELSDDAEGNNGIFYYDERRGYSHGYAPLAWVIIHDNATDFFAVPIREAETFTQLNDPEHPNCAGVYRGADPSAQCRAEKEDPAWGCAGETCEPGQGPSLTTGYFLITEIEQVRTIIGSTLCISYQTEAAADEAGWLAPDKTCRGSPLWNPKDPVKGLPRGDWCAKRNGPADDDCHDAYRNRTFHVYSAFPIRDGTCAAN